MTRGTLSYGIKQQERLSSDRVSFKRAVVWPQQSRTLRTSTQPLDPRIRNQFHLHSCFKTHSTDKTHEQTIPFLHLSSRMMWEKNCTALWPTSLNSWPQTSNGHSSYLGILLSFPRNSSSHLLSWLFALWSWLSDVSFLTEKRETFRKELSRAFTIRATHLYA